MSTFLDFSMVLFVAVFAAVFIGALPATLNLYRAARTYPRRPPDPWMPLPTARGLMMQDPRWNNKLGRLLRDGGT